MPDKVALTYKNCQAFLISEHFSKVVVLMHLMFKCHNVQIIPTITESTDTCLFSLKNTHITT